MPEREPIGAGRVLALAYGFFSLAAGARSAVQLATHASRAPLAYALSAAAAAMYVLGTVAIVRADRFGRGYRVAASLCAVEFAGVLTVGVVSGLRPQDFPDATVWSHFGSGYGYAPAVLPLLGLVWARREIVSRRRGRDARDRAGSTDRATAR